MAYQIFSQMQGPSISPSLFTDAAAQGVKTGNELPTPVTAAITGAVKGYQTGQQIEATSQENQIRGLQLEAQQATQDLTIQATKAKLQTQVDVLKQQDEDLKRKDELSKLLASNDPNQIAQIYSNPAYRGLLLDDPKYADSVAGSIYANPALPDSLKQQALGTLGVSQQLKFQEENAKLFAARDKALFSDYDQVVKKYNGTNASVMLQNVPEDELSSRVKVFPKGSVVINTDGTLNIDAAPNHSHINDALNKGLSSVFVDGKLVGDVKESEAVDIANMQRTVDAKHRSLARDIGLYYPGWKYQSPAQKAQSASVAAANTQASTPSATQPGTAAQGATSTTTVSNPNENANIVTQAQAEFDKLVANHPKGMTGEALVARRNQIKDQINQRIGPSPSAILNQATSTQAQTGTNVTAATPAAPPAPTSALQSRPGATLTGIYKQNVDLTIPEAPILSPKIRDAVNAEPLLANESPMIKAFAAVESGGNRNATSPTGVQGLLQVTKAVANSFGLNRDIPEQNLLAGKLYLTSLMHTFGGNIRLAAAAYNVGPGNIRDAILQTGSTDWEDIKGYLSTVLKPKKFKEVAGYPDKVVSYMTQFMGDGGNSDQALAYLLERNGLVKPAETQI